MTNFEKYFPGRKIDEIRRLRAENAELKQKLQDQCISCPVKMQEDDVVADLEESHKKEVGQLLMKIAELEKLVETADKVLKEKGGFTVKDITFDGVKLEGMKND